MYLIDLMPDASEIIRFDEPGIPLYIRDGCLTGLPGMRALCHWHEPLEFIRVLEGEMYYFIGGTTILLHAGDSLFVNTKQMHYGYSNQSRECLYHCILIHPSILTGSQPLFDACYAPLMRMTQSLPFVHMKRGSEMATQAAALLDEVWALKLARREGYQLDAVYQLGRLIRLIIASQPALQRTGDLREQEKLNAHRQMVGFIGEHYAENIALEDIAASAAVSKSTCSRLFKEYVNQTPFEFLNTYRLHVSCDLLERSDRSITDIAALCGYNQVSYYTREFAKRYGMPPLKYRKMKREDA